VENGHPWWPFFFCRGNTISVRMSQRVIFHVDMDAFFVSVEEIFDPTLKGKPVVVGGKADERGVVAAASYAARKFGIHSAMPLRTAAKLCPHAVFVHGHPDRYREYSHKVHEVLLSMTPSVEMASIDEAYIDMTGTERLHGHPLKAAHQLHERMKSKTALNCSIGIASSRVVAKICSDQAKPNGVLYILPGQEADFLAPLDVRKIPGVGKVTEKRLNDLGIRVIGDLAKFGEVRAQKELGDWGVSLIGKSRGEDAGGWFDEEIGESSGAKSISHEHTFDVDTADRERLESTLARLSQMVCRRMREDQVEARTIQIKLRWTDFTTITRAKTMEHPTSVDTEVFNVVRQLFRSNWKAGATVRLLGVHASGFEGDPQMQLLPDEHSNRMKTALQTADKLRDRFGEGVVSLATGMKSKFRERTHENPASLPGKKTSDRKE
jgi:DNA polymerase IV